MTKLVTYGDWYALLSEPLVHLDAHTYGLLLEGRFEESAALEVMRLVAKSVESLLSSQAGKLNRVLQDEGLAEDDVEWALVRYQGACQKVMRLCAIPGLPEEPARELDREARRYVCKVFQQVEDAFEGQGESSEVTYQTAKLRKQWMTRE